MSDNQEDQIKQAEETKNETEVSGTSESNYSDAEEPSDQMLALTITSSSPDFEPLHLGVLRTETVGDLTRQVFESEQACFLTSFALSFNDKIMPEHEEVGNIPDLVSGSTVQLVELPYDSRSARTHLRRLRTILLGPTSAESNNNKSVLSSLIQNRVSNLTTKPASSTSDNAPAAHSGPSKGKKKQPPQKGAQANKNKGRRGKAPQPVAAPQPQRRLQVDAPLNRFFPASTAQPVPQCIKSLVFSGWNPVPGNRFLRGDLFYLEATVMEGQTYIITASADGFFVNNSSLSKFEPSAHSNPAFHCHSLAGLLSAVSPHFKRNFSILLKLHFEREPLEFITVPHAPQSWLGQSADHVYNLNRAEDEISGGTSIEGPFSDPRNIIRDWNFDYQLLRDHPSANIMDRLIRDCALFKFNVEFVQEATKGVVDIINGSIAPLNPYEPAAAQMFLYNNIFFSFCTDARELYINTGGDITAHKMANNDIAGLKLFLSANVKDLHTVPTALIDYKGWRMIAQGVIPGILNCDKPSSLLYGSTLPTECPVAKDPCASHMNAVARKLLIKEHVIVDSEGKTTTFSTSPITKGLSGTDGRSYILDLFRMTPRDANYPEPQHISKILRYDLVLRYRNMMIAKEIAQILQDKKENPPAENTSESSSSSDAAPPTSLIDEETYLKISDRLRFNVDAFSEFKLSGDKDQIGLDEQQVRDLAAFLLEDAIPHMLQEWSRGFPIPSDGQSLCDTLHQHGINLRYLGRIYKLIHPSRYISRLILQEMIARSAKHIFHRMLRTSVPPRHTAQAIAYFLDCLVGKAGLAGSASVFKSGGCPYVRDSLWTAILADIEASFSVSLQVSDCADAIKLPLVRRFCQVTGVQIVARNYQMGSPYPFQEDDILDIAPLTKHIAPLSSDGNRMLKIGREHIQNGRSDLAYDYLNEALKIFHQVYGALHVDCGHTFSMIANLFFNCFDYPSAVSAQTKAVTIFERGSGLDSADTIRAYAQLGLYVSSLDPRDAMDCLDRARYLAELVGGENHPERASILANTALLYQEKSRFEASLEYLHEALKCNIHSFGFEDLRTATSFHSLAMAHSALHQYREALEFEKNCYNIMKIRLGEEDKATIQSNTWLKEFTRKAVETAAHPPSAPSSAPSSSIRLPGLPSLGKRPMSVSDDLKKTKAAVARMTSQLHHAQKTPIPPAKI